MLPLNEYCTDSFINFNLTLLICFNGSKDVKLKSHSLAMLKRWSELRTCNVQYFNSEGSSVLKKFCPRKKKEHFV